MKLYALSDLHIDYTANRAWVESLSDVAYREDLLILAGDLSDASELLDWCFAALARRFRKVLYVPGNHDLWVLRDRPDMLSTGKLERLRGLCAEHGVSMSPLHFGALSVVPLMSWYDNSFGVPSEALRERWMDYHACRWPAGLHGDAINAHFLTMNEVALQVRNGTVVSFSHFVPRADLLTGESPTARLLLPVMGSTGLEAQVRRLRPAIHVYGHSHRNVDVKRDGIRYVNRSFGYPNERGSGAAELRCILDLAANAPSQSTDAHL